MTGRGLLLVFVDPTSPDTEPAFNDWFDRIHLDEVLQIEGLAAGARYRRVPVETAWSPIDQRYLTAIEIESDDIAAVAAALTIASPTMVPSDTVCRDPRPAVMWFEAHTPRRSPMDDLLRELHDRTTILEVMALMTRSLDTGDWDLLGSIVAPELVVDFSSYARAPKVSDGEAWLANLRRVFPHLAATAHTTSNPVVRIDGDRANCSVHMQAKHVRPTERGEGWYDLGGYYDFDLVRREGAWLISRLVHTTTWESGNPRIMQEAAAAAAASD